MDKALSLLPAKVRNRSPMAVEKMSKKIIWMEPQRHLLFQPAAACFRGKWVMELGCSHFSVWALTIQPQSGPSEQDYTSAVKNKLLRQIRIPFSEWERWTGRCVGSGGEISPRAWCRHPCEGQAQTQDPLLVLWHGEAVSQRGEMWQVSQAALGS